MKHRNIYLVLIVALLLRLVAINQSLWLDEATTAQTVKHFNYLDLITRFAPTDFHPPLYYLFMKVWTSIFGYSEVALRMPSVIFSLISGWFVYLIGNRIISKNSGVWAAAFFLFNPLIVYYSQEARMYTMVTCFLTTAIYLYISLVSSSRHHINKIILLNVFIALSLFTFYGSIFFIAALYAYILIERFMDLPLRGTVADFRRDDGKSRSYRVLLQTLPGSIIALLILSPLLYVQYIHSKEMLSLVPNWSMVLGTANLKNIVLIPIKFSIGRIQFEPKKLYYLAAGVWTLFVFSYIVIGGLKNKMTAFLFSIPLILGFIFSFFTPLLQYFRFVYLIPLYALLIAIGISRKYKRILYLIPFILLSLIYLLMPQFHRENWRALAGTIVPGEPVYMIYSSSDPMRYYLDRYENPSQIKDLRSAGHNQKEKTIVVIPYTADIHGVAYKDVLSKKGYKSVITFSARGLTSEVWQKK